MKRNIGKDEFEALDEHIRALYKESGDGYALELEDDDTGPLKRAKEHEKRLRQEAEKKARELEARLADIESKLDADKTESLKSKGDIDALEKSWQEKVAKIEQAKQAEQEKLQSRLRELLVDNVAHSIASEIATVPELILPHIKSRLTTAEIDGKLTTRVLDQTGSPSALSVEELKGEFVADPKFSAVIVGSKAKGGGAAGGAGAGGFDIKQYRNDDGSVNWMKVAQAASNDETVIEKVKETLQTPPAPQLSMAPA
jgi:alanyl-tRNA synthetase